MALTSPEKSGNTKRISASKKWCFTLNNYEEDEWLQILEVLKEKGKFIMGKEVGEQGTPHIQGYVEFHKKCRPLECIKNKRIHWEKAKGNQEQNLKYCSKDGIYESNFEIEFDPMHNIELKQWQQDILDICNRQEINRKIHWYWEDIGGVGKTSLAHHICLKYNAIYVSGKSADIKCAIAQSRRKPNIVIFDCPRTQEGYVSYEALESIKNGIFFNGKYESGMVMMRPPIVIVFANFKPEEHKLSRDRWNIVEISN